ncbi:TonB-dependent receptor plug domain-containing protein [Massilia sp. LjRoot122]|uniref:TonB-dependent receptor plug domain-containing protein n=1 Tax=Massilia sp. LjRoot122 TaxID=3342257 RepID=UPI003ECED398
MLTLKRIPQSVLLALYGGAAFASLIPAAFAQSTAQAPATTPVAAGTPAAAAVQDSIQSVNVVGSRRVGSSSSTDTPVPIDFIPMTKASEQGGQFDLAQVLNNVSPSFNSTRQTGADGADLVDSAALRGLGSDQTLVLVNGKRRHTTALVNLFGARNRGNTGTDMNAIPVMAIRNVQVLRDGAAAQYGSDAIAGVLNIELKKNLGCEMALGFGQYTEGDGDNYLASAYCGVAVGGGVLGITGEYYDRGRSNRAEEGNPRIIGDTKSQNSTVYLNGEFPTGPGKLYVTAGAQNRDASSAAWAREGVGSEDIPSRNSAAMYPNGFVPFINGDINDHYGTLGYRFRLGEWNTDVSQTFGQNRMRYTIANTLNASIANLDRQRGGRGVSASMFGAGGFSFRQATTNLDFSRFYEGIGNGMNVAFGFEHRRENYQINAGEPGSWIDADGVGVGGNAGSQGFPGFQPGDETDSDRHSNAAYLDIETDLSERLKLQAALRHERYSDFGATTTGKLAASYRINPAVLLRGSASTGFRAPSLQQVYFSSTFTDFVSGQPLDVVLAPNGGRVANAAGIPQLKEEESKSYTLGLTWSPGAATSLTADLYRINIDDRIVLSGRFDADNYPALGATLQQLGVGQAQFFVNSVDTKTQGLDVTLSHRMDLGAGKLNAFLALNFSKTEVTGVHAPSALVGFEDVLLSERERLFIEEGAPRRKATLGFDHTVGKLETALRIVHFGPQTLGTFSGPPVPNQYYKPKTSADLSFTWAFTDKTKFTVGGTNIFDVKPSEQDPNETDNGFKYESVQFGLNGAAWFARLSHKF